MITLLFSGLSARMAGYKPIWMTICVCGPRTVPLLGKKRVTRRKEKARAGERPVLISNTRSAGYS